MKITPNKILWFDKINDHIMTVAEQYFSLYNNYHGDIKISMIYSDGSIMFEIVVSEGCCGYYEDVSHYKTIPVDCFCTDDWYKKLQLEVETEKLRDKARAEKDRLDKAKQDKERQDKIDRNTYEQLKQKFEPNNINSK